MKTVTLNFREVAVDGLPEESMDCVIKCESGYQPGLLPFSARYGLFNTYDSQDEAGTEFNDVTHWIPMREFLSAFKEASPNAD